jgi:transglutaminase superfamily protein
MWERLRRFRALPPAARRLFLRALLLLPVLSALLGLRGFRRTRHFLQKRMAGRKPLPAGISEEEFAGWAARMMLAAARHSPFPGTCLERSLALEWLLKQRGIVVQLKIGVRKAGGEFKAHAWIERDGQAIAEPEGSHLHYAAFGEEMSGDIS